SKEWIVRRGKHREEEFIGDVRYDSAGTRLSADWALFRHGPDDWQARGRIAARRELPSGDVFQAFGEKAYDDEKSMRGWLEPAPGGLVEVLRAPALGGPPDRAEGDRLTWSDERAGVLTGRARGWGPRGEFWAGAARYDLLRPGRSLTLTGGRPVLHNLAGGVDAALKADRIMVEDDPRRAVVTGRAVGWVLALSSTTPASGPEAERCGQEGRSEGPGPDEKVAALLAPLPAEDASAGESRFWRAEAAAFADRACPWGARYNFWADEADYESLPDRRVTLTGGRPVLRKIEADSSLALKADRIVAVASTRRLEAEGGVRGWMTFQNEAKYTEKPR
ncbi:MAG TPA: hypothetical protein VH309_06735, partial [Elusimicrobiota bacterium]|nr:hypothetical protein [Elusimicrobiota bacterium]